MTQAMSDSAINKAIALTERLRSGESLDKSDRETLERLVGEMAMTIRTEGDRSVGIPAVDAERLRLLVANVRKAREPMTPGVYAIDPPDPYSTTSTVWVSNPACRSPHPIRWGKHAGRNRPECICTRIGLLDDDRDTVGIAEEHNAIPSLLDGLELLLARRA